MTSISDLVHQLTKRLPSNRLSHCGLYIPGDGSTLDLSILDHGKANHGYIPLKAPSTLVDLIEIGT